MLQKKELEWLGYATGLSCCENRREKEKVDERGDDREDTNCSYQQRQCFKKPQMPVQLSKEVPDTRQMQWPARGTDGREGGKKLRFLSVFF